MQVAIGIIVIASVLEVRYLFMIHEKKEAVIYLIITAPTLGLFAYLMLAPQIYSFARMMIDLFHIQ
jgi:hypothetical protein